MKIKETTITTGELSGDGVFTPEVGNHKALLVGEVSLPDTIDFDTIHSKMLYPINTPTLTVDKVNNKIITSPYSTLKGFAGYHASTTFIISDVLSDVENVTETATVITKTIDMLWLELSYFTKRPLYVKAKHVSNLFESKYSETITITDEFIGISKPTVTVNNITATEITPSLNISSFLPISCSDTLKSVLVEYSEDDTFAVSNKITFTNDTYVLPKLTPNTTYYLRVKQLGLTYESDYSDVMSFKTLANAMMPIIDIPLTGFESGVITGKITNYDANCIYNPSVTKGSVSVIKDTISWRLPNITTTDTLEEAVIAITAYSLEAGVGASTTARIKVAIKRIPNDNSILFTYDTVSIKEKVTSLQDSNKCTVFNPKINDIVAKHISHTVVITKNVSILDTLNQPLEFSDFHYLVDSVTLNAGDVVIDNNNNRATVISVDVADRHVLLDTVLTTTALYFVPKVSSGMSFLELENVSITDSIMTTTYNTNTYTSGDDINVLTDKSVLLDLSFSVMY